MAEQSSNIERQAESRQMPEGDLTTKQVEAKAQSAEQTAKTTVKDEGNPGEAKADSSQATWTDKKTGTVYKQGDQPITRNPLEDGTLGTKKSEESETKSETKESMMDKAKHMLHHEK